MKEMIIKIPDKAIGEDRGKFIKVIKVEDVKKLIQKTQEQMIERIEDLMIKKSVYEWDKISKELKQSIKAMKIKKDFQTPNKLRVKEE